MQKKIVLLFILLVNTALSQIPRYTVTMKEEDYKSLFYRDSFNDEFLPATFTFNDTTWEDVKIRFKGRSKRYFPKKSFRIKFPKKHQFQKVHQINLHAMYNDRSFIREKLAYDLFEEMGMLSPHSEYVALNFNRDATSLYLLVDRINSDFLKRHGKTISSLYNTDGFYSLADLTEQPDDILKLYYPKEVGDANDYVDLKKLLHAINSAPDSLFEKIASNIFDMPSVYNWLAGNILMMMGDSYNKNYFLYKDVSHKTNQWVVIPWDYDIAFGLSGDLALPYPESILNDGFTYSFPPLSGPESVLKNRLWASPNMREQLRQRVDTLLHTIFTEEHLFPHIDSLAALIKDQVSQDPTKRGIYQDYLYNVEVLKSFITWRRNFLLKTFVNQPGGMFNMVTLQISQLNKPYHFVELDGRTIATMWFTELQGLDSITVVAHSDTFPPILKVTDTAKCVKRWVEIISSPPNAKFGAKLQWMYRDVSSLDREVGTGVNDEASLQAFYYDGISLVRLPAKVNPYSNAVTVNFIYEQQCGYGKYFFLAMP